MRSGALDGVGVIEFECESLSQGLFIVRKGFFWGTGFVGWGDDYTADISTICHRLESKEQGWW